MTSMKKWPFLLVLAAVSNFQKPPFFSLLDVKCWEKCRSWFRWKYFSTRFKSESNFGRICENFVLNFYYFNDGWTKQIHCQIERNLQTSISHWNFWWIMKQLEKSIDLRINSWIKRRSESEETSLCRRTNTRRRNSLLMRTTFTSSDHQWSLLILSKCDKSEINRRSMQSFLLHYSDELLFSSRFNLKMKTD